MQRSQKGLSLIELMVAMAIGLFLLLGVSKIFLDSKRTYSFQQSLARIQENGRMAQEFMGRDIRMAGYTGCASGDYSSITNTLNNPTAINYDFSRGVSGYDVGTSVPTDLSALSPAPLINTDVLILKGPVGDGVNVVGNKGSDANIEVKVINPESGACANGSERISGICVGDILMVADCTKARVFQATNTQVSGSPQTLKIVHSATGTPGNATASWGGNGANAFPEAIFDTAAEIIKMNTVYYYIATGASGQPALWQAIVPGAAQEILEGVENLQLIYGRDTNSDLVPDRYEDATAITTANAWDKVGAIRIQLLMRSVEANVTDAAQPYSFNGADVTPTDKRLRHVFVSTIGVRAKMP